MTLIEAKRKLGYIQEKCNEADIALHLAFSRAIRDGKTLRLTSAERQEVSDLMEQVKNTAEALQSEP